VYDISNDKWTSITDNNHGRHAASACILNQVIYLIGGRIGNEKTTDLIESYEISNQKWSTIKVNNSFFASNPWTPTGRPISFVLSTNEIIIGGGRDNNRKEQSGCYVFNVQSETVKKHSQLPSETWFR